MTQNINLWSCVCFLATYIVNVAVNVFFMTKQIKSVKYIFLLQKYDEL